MRLELNGARELTEFARSAGWLASDVYVRELTVAGEGNMNQVLRASLSDGRSLVFKQSLPYVARYPQIPAPVDRLDYEFRFYNAVRTRPFLSARCPQLIGYDNKQHLLCLQDLGAVRDLTSAYDAADGAAKLLEVAPDLLSWLSDLHHLQISEDEQPGFRNPEMRRLNHQHIFEIPFRADNGLELAPELMQQAALIRQQPQLLEMTARLGRIYLGEQPGTSAPALLHGDFYPGSWVDTADHLAIIDPEFCFVGPAEFEVGVFLAHLLMSGVSCEKLQLLLDDYRPVVGFRSDLAFCFAAVEVLRRLLGVAQLPLQAGSEQKVNWIRQALKWLTAGCDSAW